MQSMLDDLYARSQKGQKFYNLYDLILDERNIQLAYRSIKRNHGSRTPSENKHTISDWETQPLESYVEYITKRLKNYHPHTVRRVEIPKLSGGTRPLGIPSIEDRLVQQCILQILDPIVEAKFHPHSYGFRPNRSAKHAIAAFLQRVNIGHCFYVVDVDIKGFFDNVQHGKLIKQLWTLGIRDKRLLSIISKILKAEIAGVGFPEKGTPQGGIISPLLANVVLNEFDWWIESQWGKMPALEGKFKLQRNKQGIAIKSNLYHAMRKYTKLKEIYIVRYADDFKILCKDIRHAEKVYHASKEWLSDRLGLEISPEKSKVIDIRKQPSEFLGFTFKAVPKGKETNGDTRYVVQSHITPKGKEKAIEKIRECVKALQKEQSVQNINRFNSTVLGLHNYYSLATQCSKDFSDINYRTLKCTYNRLKKVNKKVETTSLTYQKYYGKYNYKKYFIKGIALFPVAGCTQRNSIMFRQETCNYTPEGRLLIHADLRMNISTLRWLMENPNSHESTELCDNRISRYVGQQGKCAVTGNILIPHEMELHHVKRKTDGGTDEYNNLVWVMDSIHKLIHSTEQETINKYLKLVHLEVENRKKLNKYRLEVGNIEI